jgi:hypothetical protein
MGQPIAHILLTLRAQEHEARAGHQFGLADDLRAAITLIERQERELFVRRAKADGTQTGQEKTKPLKSLPK